jgi:hypothetical protein
MYNYNSRLGKEPHGPTLRGLVNSGADLLKQMYDVSILFPDQMTGDGLESDQLFGYPVTVRAEGFTVPDATMATYDITYHGVSVKRPGGKLDFAREFEITFREDAAFMLRQRFSLWMMAVADPVTGGVSNAVNVFGTVSVRTIAGEYTSSHLIDPTGEPGPSDKDEQNQILKTTGQIPTKAEQKNGQRHADTNPVAEWNFYHVWVSKVGGVQFSTGASEANTFAVQFQFQDCDIPFFGGNPIFEK